MQDEDGKNVGLEGGRVAKDTVVAVSWSRADLAIAIAIHVVDCPRKLWESSWGRVFQNWRAHARATRR